MGWVTDVAAGVGASIGAGAGAALSGRFGATVLGPVGASIGAGVGANLDPTTGIEPTVNAVLAVLDARGPDDSDVAATQPPKGAHMRQEQWPGTEQRQTTPSLNVVRWETPLRAEQAAAVAQRGGAGSNMYRPQQQPEGAAQPQPAPEQPPPAETRAPALVQRGAVKLPPPKRRRWWVAPLAAGVGLTAGAALIVIDRS